MKASDYIVSQLYERGVSHLFEVAGGMITHLLDSADRHGRIYLVSVHHEQAAAFAAHGMAFVTGVPGVAMATSGPGAVNLLTGIGGCYFDSVPAIFLTGQVNLAEQKGTRPIRQLGFQETDIISMAGPVTKAALMARSARAVPGLLDRAFEVALSGRPGPVLLDLPMDVQRSDVPVASRPRSHASSAPADEAGAIDTILSALNTARKPLILAGGGINAARAAATFRQLADVLNVPVVNSLMAVDVLPSGHRLRVGLIGTYGNRWANLALSECDTLIVLGSRLDVRQTGSDTAFLQSGRTIIQVDCDEAEIGSRVRVDRPVVADLRSLLPQLLQAVPGTTFPRYDAWKRRIRNLRRRWPDVGETPAGTGLNPNEIMHELSQVSTEAAAYVVDTGNHQMWAAQSLDLGVGQKFLTSGGMGAMGFSLPAAIGASLALPGQPIVQIAGDGGMQLNIQELETVAHHGLPIKMVIINNQSYGMVRQFQQSYFQERYASTLRGYSSPNLEKVAQAYGIDATTVSQRAGALRRGLAQMWAQPEAPFLLQIKVDPGINAYPKIAYGLPLSEMEPFAKPLDMEGT